jgi:hypothetical protein
LAGGGAAAAFFAWGPSTDFNGVFLAGAFLAGAAFLIGTLSCRARLVDAATARDDLCSLEGGVTKSLSD